MNIRPTSDRVKEALFNILGGMLDGFAGLRVLDLFAGTGNLGIEALSRGASFAVFVDNSREGISLVRQNLDCLGLGQRGRLLPMGVMEAMASLEAAGDRFDLVFLDPPYAGGAAAAVLHRLAGSKVVQGDTVVVAEVASRGTPPEIPSPLRLVDRRVYGDTALLFLLLDEEG